MPQVQAKKKKKKVKNEKRILKATRKKQRVILKGTPISLSVNFSAENLQARREGKIHSKC